MYFHIYVLVFRNDVFADLKLMSSEVSVRFCS